MNRQTGQGGTTYDADRDLGRVPLTRTSGGASVEAFTIDVEARGGRGGTIVLRWDRDAFAVPFTVDD